MPLPLDLPAIFRRTLYVVVGARAAQLYLPARHTFDTGILIRAEDARMAADELRTVKARRVGPLAIPGETWRLEDGEELDVLHGNEPWIETALSSPRPGPGGVPCIDLPWLVLMKLTASRTQDLADLSRMLGAASEADAARVCAAIARFQPQDLEDAASLRQLGQLECGGERPPASP